MVAPDRELADFLRRARAQCDPARAGLPPDPRVRRVPGRRREEVARLAGVFADYYARLEQGRRITPSPAVVEALAQALELGAAGRDAYTAGDQFTDVACTVPDPTVGPQSIAARRADLRRGDADRLAQLTGLDLPFHAWIGVAGDRRRDGDPDRRAV